jgi:hypothetical protein
MQLLMFSSMVNISYMGLKLGKLQAPLMFPLPVVIYGVWSYILYKFDRISNNASCRRAMAADINRSRGAGSDRANSCGGANGRDDVNQAYNDNDSKNYKLKESDLPSNEKRYDIDDDIIYDKKEGEIELVSLMTPNDDTIVGITTNTSLFTKKKNNNGRRSVTSDITVDTRNEQDIVKVDVKIDHHHNDDHNDADDVKDHDHIDGNDNHDIKIELIEKEEGNNNVTKKSVDFYLPALLLEPIILEPFMYRLDDVPLFERERTACLIDTIHLNPIYNDPREVSLDEIMHHYYSSDTIV